MDIITKANDASVIMKLLLRELGLPAQTTHARFVEAFSGLQNQRLQFEKELQQMYLDSIKNPGLKQVMEENGMPIPEEAAK